MDLIFLACKIIVIAWFVSELDPLQKVFEFLAEKSGFFNVVFYQLVSCWKCLSFWMGLVFFVYGWYLPIWLVFASSVAFAVKIIEKLISRL